MFQRFDIHSRIVRRCGITFYGARDKLAAREVWLWRLHEYGEHGPPDEALLNAERTALRAPRHPCILPVLELEADPDGLVAHLQPAEGETLDEWLAKGQIGMEDFAAIAASCLEAISAGAAAGVPHGALEPGLIFTRIDGEGQRKTQVLGFGVARLVAKLHGDNLETSEAADLWMLGGILYSALTGALVQEGQPLLPPQEINSDVTPAISEWIMRLLTAEGDAGFESAAAALAELQRLLAPPAQEPEFAHPQALPGWWPPSQQPVYDPNAPPIWHYPPQPMWHIPPPPMDPAWAAAQQQAWQQQPIPMPYWQSPPQPMEAEVAPPAGEPPATKPVTKPLPKPVARQPSGPLVKTPAPAAGGAPNTRPPSAPLKKTSEADKAAEPVQPPAPKDIHRWLGPLVSLSTVVLLAWLFRASLAPFFQADIWRGLFGKDQRVDEVAMKAAPAVEAPPKANAGTNGKVAAKPKATSSEKPATKSQSKPKARAKPKQNPPANNPAKSTN